MRTDIVKAAIRAALQALKGSDTTLLQSVLTDSLHCIQTLEKEVAELKKTIATNRANVH